MAKKETPYALKYQKTSTFGRPMQFAKYQIGKLMGFLSSSTKKHSTCKESLINKEK